MYSEGMRGRCALESGGQRYAVRQNPWAYFVSERRLCRQNSVSMRPFKADVSAGGLPNAGLVVPNLCHDAHDRDCDLGDAEAWLNDTIGSVLAGPDSASGALAVVVTADEDDHSQDNRLHTVVLHGSQSHRVVRDQLDHYSLARLYGQVLGRPQLRGGKNATEMARAFDLPLSK